MYIFFLFFFINAVFIYFYKFLSIFDTYGLRARDAARADWLRHVKCHVTTHLVSIRTVLFQKKK